MGKYIWEGTPANLAGVDLKRGNIFCGVVGVSESLVDLVFVAEKHTGRQMMLVKFFTNRLNLDSLAGGLYEDSLARVVDGVPPLSTDWPKSVLLKPYDVQLTPKGRLSSKTPSSVSDGSESLLLSFEDCTKLVALSRNMQSTPWLTVAGAELNHWGVFLTTKDADGNEHLLGIPSESPVGPMVVQSNGLVGHEVMAVYKEVYEVVTLYVRRSR